jgi:hypothetical protein
MSQPTQLRSVLSSILDVHIRLVTICRVLPVRSPSTLCSGSTTLGHQQAHVYHLYPAEEGPQLDPGCSHSLGDDLSCVACPVSLHPV